MNMLGMVVKGLTRLDDLIPTIEELGKRHVDYGVTEEMYPAVGEALLWTLEKGLSEAFTEEVRLAWHAAYSTLQSVMCKAAKSSVS
jgi:nitric oxide dioxygenase